MSNQLPGTLAALEASDVDVSIPMPGEVIDSLNAAASAAIQPGCWFMILDRRVGPRAAADRA